MSTVVDDPIVDPPEISDEEILTRCREIEVRRRADLAEHIQLLRELEKRKLYYSDGHRDLAGYGRAEFRWADPRREAHRDLERLCRNCPQVLDALTIGRVTPRLRGSGGRPRGTSRRRRCRSRGRSPTRSRRAR